MTDNQIKVILVENDPSVRFRLERTLEGLGDIHVIGSATTRREADSLVSQFKFHTLLVDLDLPDGFGLELIRRTAEKLPNVDIMVLAQANDDPHVVSAIESGATGYVLKSEIEKAKEQNDKILSFMILIHKYSSFEELTPEILRSFIDKVIVHEKTKVDGHYRQTVEIIYNFVGAIDKPLFAEEIN